MSSFRVDDLLIKHLFFIVNHWYLLFKMIAIFLFSIIVIKASRLLHFSGFVLVGGGCKGVSVGWRRSTSRSLYTYSVKERRKENA